QQMLIGINRNHHLHRRRFSVGHEIGHLLLNHPPEIACNSAEIILYDREADECASELLMPEELLAPMARKVSGIEQLSRMFQVSVQAMERRLNRLEEESL
ncbi:MAG: ImmA/IrrE family metallo-endopeptidase, partial [Ignavibacteriales bacterium]|nr:ImmA/IrrE family metallo-endopeptidase [Ignavibacteriales bacterium]